MEAGTFIPVGNNHAIQQCESSSWFYDVYCVKVSKRHPDGKLEAVSWGVPLEKALDLIAHRETDGVETIQELIDRIARNRKEFIQALKELQK